MEKIKSVLSGHKKTDDAAHDPTVSSTSGTSQTNTPIHNQMTNPRDAHAVGHTQPFLGQGTQDVSGVGNREHIGTGGPIGSAHTGTEQPPRFSNAPNVYQNNPTSANSATSSGPTNTLSSHVRPSAPTDSVSNASIKSGVIGFGSNVEQGHAALPNRNTAEDDLDRNQILGGGNSGNVTGEQRNIQPTTLPQPGTASRGHHDFAYSGNTANQPLHSSSQQDNYTTGADRSFPLSGGVTSNDPDSTSASARQFGTGSSAPLPHSERRNVQGLAEETREATYGTTGGEPPITEQDRTGLLAGVRPFNKRTDTHPHIPGEFPDPTPAENPSQTFFGQDSVGTTSATDAPSTQSELRHTGTLDQPRPKSGDFTPDQPRHQSRGAAIAGGVGAAGMGTYGTPQKHDTRSGNPYEVSPYSSTSLDPRVYGKSGPPLEKQRFNPQTRTEPSARQSLPIRESKGSSAVPASSVGGREEPKHHYGRDAAAIGAGTAAVGGLSGVSQPDHARNAQRVPSESGVPVTQQPSTATDRFYGTSGAPAPRVDNAHTAASATPSSSVTPGSHIKDEPHTHHGRDAALGGAGLATAGGLHHANQNDGRGDTGPASKTVGPHSSNIANILDPRVQPDPAKQKSHDLSGAHQSDRNVDDKAGHQDKHHYGRDAAVAGGVGTAGYGAYEAANAYGDHRSTQPEASMMNQRYDPTAPGAHAPNPTPANAEYNYNEPRHDAHGTLTGGQPSTGLNDNQRGTSGLSDTHNSGLRHSENDPTGPHSSHLANKADPRVDSNRIGEAGDNYGARSPEDDRTHTGTGIGNTHDTHDHTSRNAALGVGVGAAALSGAVFTGTTHHDSTQRLPESENPVSLVASSAAPVPITNYQPWQPLQSDWPASHTTQEPFTSSTNPTEGSSAYSANTPTMGSAAHPTHGTTSHTSSVPVTEHRHGDAENLEDGSHKKRDVALLGTAGAAALAGAGSSHTDRSTRDSPNYESSRASSAYGTQTPPVSTSIHPSHGTASHSSAVPVNQQRYDNVEDQERGDREKRNAALLGTGAAATLAGAGHAHHGASQPPYDYSATSTHSTQGTAPHDSHVPIAPTTQQRYDNVEDPENRSHDNRNAALLGTTGAAALAGTGLAHHHATQPTQNPSAYATHAPVASEVHPSQSTVPYGTQAPGGIATQQRYDPIENSERQSHDKRNAALLGTAGAGTALGVGHTHHNAGQPTQDPALYGSQAPVTSAMNPATTGHNTQVLPNTTTHQRYDTVDDPMQKDHDKRNAALLGTAGAATAAGAGYAYTQKQDQQNLFETQERLAKMEKLHEKEQAKLEKDTYRQEEKDQHKLDKERAKLQKSHPEPEEKDKKHGILGFLHRDKSKKERTSPSADTTPRASGDYSRESPRHSKDLSRESPRHSKEYPDPRTTAAAYEDLPVDLSGRNKLHKDPPQGHPARDALEHPEVFASGGLGNRERIGVDGPIGHPDLISGDRETQRNTYGAHPISDLDSDKVVIEPHTGLPMNIGRYGDGHGGTDGSNTVPGAHLHSPTHVAGSSSTTNWDGVKKGDTAY